jgi:serine/threonine-protein kinase
VTLDRQLVVDALPAYEVGEELGRGACGIVLRGTHRRLGREVAIKQLPRAFGADPAARRRFTGEAQLLASFDHPHIVPIFDYVEHEGLCLLVMERLTGGTLWDRMQAGDAVEAQIACAIVLAACTGLHYAHERGVLHRDVKPDNLMFASSGTLKVTDFGIAKVVGSMTISTMAGDVVGTPAYIAPEQAQSQGLTPATDVYALGTVFYELLSGQLPYPAVDDPVVFLYQHVHEEPRPLATIVPGVPPALARVADTAIRRDPRERYASADAFGAALAVAAAETWGPDWLQHTRVRVLGAGEMLDAVEGGRSRAPTLQESPRPGAPATVSAHDPPTLTPSTAWSATPAATPGGPVSSPSTPAPAVAPPAAPPGGPAAPVTPPPTPPPVALSSLPPERRPRNGLRVLVALLAVLVVAGGIIGGIVLFGGDDGSSDDSTSESTTAGPSTPPSEDLVAERALLTDDDLPSRWVEVSPPPLDEPTSEQESALAADVRVCAGAAPDNSPIEVRGARYSDPDGTLFAESRASLAATNADARTNFELFASAPYLDCLRRELPNYLDPGTEIGELIRLTEGRATELDVTGYQLETKAPDALNPSYQHTIVIRRGRLLLSLNLASADGPFPADRLDEIASRVGDRLSADEN